jgi:hypothetical protein
MLGMVAAWCEGQANNAEVTEFIAPLRALAAEWESLARGIAARAAADPEEVGAASYDFLMYSGYAALAYWWARSAGAAASGADPDLARSKRDTARFYFARLLPRTRQHKAAIEAGATSLMSLPADGFGR